MHIYIFNYAFEDVLVQWNDSKPALDSCPLVKILSAIIKLIEGLVDLLIVRMPDWFNN